MTASATLSQPVDLVVCPDTPEALTATSPPAAGSAAPVSPGAKFAPAAEPTVTAPTAAVNEDELHVELAAVTTELAELHRDDEIARRMTAVTEWRQEIGHNIQRLGRRKRALRTLLGLDHPSQPATPQP